jgi:phosphomannomutase
VPPGAAALIGHDARHGSARFADVVGRELRARGVTDVSAGMVPTPVLAFATRRGDYTAGIMITASHNPAADNGIKVYDGTGAQLDLEQAAEVEAAIAGPRAPFPAVTLPRRTLDTVPAYLEALPQVQGGPLVMAYTPLHGVGGEVFAQALRRSGFPAAAVVTNQAAPDPDFPTAPFPNPEEPGVLDGLRALAREADLGLAHDPDADRLAVVVGSRTLTGDEVGLLLADDVLSRTPGPVATTVVSSSALAVLARRRGVPYTETLTGFRHLVRAHGGQLVFGYEEALGYCVAPGTVRDKDGISAGLLICAMAAQDKARGRTLLDRLARLEAELGIEVATGQVNIRCPDPEALLAKAQAAVPPGFTESRTDPYTVSSGDRRIILRASGTEPKLKAYLQTGRRRDLPVLRALVEGWLGLAG